MTDPSGQENVLLRYMREEMSTLRATMHDELAAIRKDIMSLSQELREASNEQRPRIAKLEQRADRLERDIDEIKQERTTDRGLRIRMWSAVAAAVISPVLSGVFVWVGG